MVALLPLLLAGCTAARPVAVASPAAPRPSFPAVSGRVLDSSAADGEWRVRVRVADSDEAYRDARSRLVRGGFTLTKDREGTGGGDGQACREDLCVGFTATDLDGSGPTVAYEVFHPLGITTAG